MGATGLKMTETTQKSIGFVFLVRLITLQDIGRQMSKAKAVERSQGLHMLNRGKTYLNSVDLDPRSTKPISVKFPRPIYYGVKI